MSQRKPRKNLMLLFRCHPVLTPLSLFPSLHSSRLLRRPLGSRPRLPVHLYMTSTIRNRIKNLDEQFTRTMESMALLHDTATRPPPELPSPQVISVTLSGRILTENQVKVRKGERGSI